MILGRKAQIKISSARMPYQMVTGSRSPSDEQTAKTIVTIKPMASVVREAIPVVNHTNAPTAITIGKMGGQRPIAPLDGRARLLREPLRLVETAETAENVGERDDAQRRLR